ncbi:hypothetical protein OAF64_08665, partial [Crocinitomicaceae bacterium]|nr:hypothetical protein [Crocinitomicaceae bacterium]
LILPVITSISTILAITRIYNVKTDNRIMTCGGFGVFYVLVSVIWTTYINYTREQEIEYYMKTTNTYIVPVTIQKVQYNKLTDSYLRIQLKTTNDTKAPLNYFYLNDLVDQNKFMKGDTLYFHISKDFPNLFEIRHQSGKEVRKF